MIPLSAFDPFQQRVGLVVADGDEVDAALAVDLATEENEHIDAALPGAVEQLAGAIGEEVKKV